MAFPPKPKAHINSYNFPSHSPKPPLPIARQRAEVSHVQFPVLESRSKSTQQLHLPSLHRGEGKRQRKMSVHLDKGFSKLDFPKPIASTEAVPKRK